MRQFLLISLFVLAGCVSSSEFGLDNPQVSLTPNSDGTFTYVSYANKKHPADDENAELRRLSGMVDRFEANDYCPGSTWGFVKNTRRVVKKNEDFSEVIQKFRCR